MKSEYKKIIDKAMELSRLIKSHELTYDYYQSINDVKESEESLKLLHKMTDLGEELNRKMQNPDNIDTVENKEYDNLKHEFENDPHVKNFLKNQKSYLNMIGLTLGKIKDPIE